MFTCSYNEKKFVVNRYGSSVELHFNQLEGLLMGKNTRYLFIDAYLCICVGLCQFWKEEDHDDVLWRMRSLLTNRRDLEHHFS